MSELGLLINCGIIFVCLDTYKVEKRLLLFTRLHGFGFLVMWSLAAIWKQGLTTYFCLELEMRCTIQYNWSLKFPFSLVLAKLRSALSHFGRADLIVMQSIVELAQGPYVAAWAGFEPVTFWTQGTEPSTEPPCLTSSLSCYFCTLFCFFLLNTALASLSYSSIFLSQHAPAFTYVLSQNIW